MFGHIDSVGWRLSLGEDGWGWQGSHGHGKSWKILKFETILEKSWIFVLFQEVMEN